MMSGVAIFAGALSVIALGAAPQRHGLRRTSDLRPMITFRDQQLIGTMQHGELQAWPCAEARAAST